MKFISNKQTFLKSLSAIEGIISSREVRSPIGNVLIEAGKNGLSMTATDLEMTLRTECEANVLVPGSILLPARKLSQTVREFRYESFEFSVEKEVNVQIHDANGLGKTEIEMVGSPADEFQVRLNEDNQKYVSIPPSVVSDMIDRSAYAVAEDDTRFAFNGLYAEYADSRLTFVGTDGRRLSLVSRALPEPVGGGIIIPIKAVRELRKLLGGSDEFAMAVEKAENTIYFRLKDVIFITRLIDSNFPEYSQVIPKKLEHTVSLEREDLRLAIKQAAVLAAEPSRQIQLKFTSGEVFVTSSTPDVGRVEDAVACNYAGEPVTIAFNSNYLLEVLSVIKGDKVEILLSSSSAPAVLHDPEDKYFKAVIMPMRL